jgi:thiamine biosynthesis lipoprotein
MNKRICMLNQKRPSRRRAGRLCARLFALLFLTALAGCRQPVVYTEQLYVFGTLVEVTVRGVPEPQAEQALADLQQMFNRMHREWHAWEPGLLTRINAAFARGEHVEANDEIVTLVQRSQELERASGGRFNPAIGGIIELWGFHTSDYPIIGPPPSREQIQWWLDQAPSTTDIEISGVDLYSRNPAVQLDFGGVAKGYAVDLAIEHLEAQGIRDAIVNAGGDLRAVGSHGDRPWRVAVRKPGGGVIGAVEVEGDESLFTSGNYERFRQDNEKRYPHILDPRTGWPVGEVASATVITSEGLKADAAATALIVAGLDEWPDVARAMQLRQVLIVDEDGAVTMTPDMAERVHFAEPLQPKIVDPFH